MRVFVTGSTGFIGSHFLQAAIASGHDVLALRRSKSSVPKIKLFAEPCWINKLMRDVRSDDLKGVDVIMHLAAAGVTKRSDDWAHVFEVNVHESLALWRTALEGGVRRLVVCGSYFEYGRSADRCKQLSSDTPLEPITAYAASKAAASMAAIGLAAACRCEVLLLRLFHVFGEGEAPERFWPALRRAAQAGENFSMTLGEQVRDFVPIERAAQQLLAACERDDVKRGEAIILNVGTGQPQTLREFAETWWRRWEAKGRLLFGALPYREGEVMRFVPQLS